MIATREQETIIACASPSGPGAIALLRISGQDAVLIADRIAKLPGNKKLADQPTHTIHYGEVVDHNNQTIDYVLFLLMRAPRTFTGQDTIEITCHNNGAIIESIMQATIRAGARCAQQGEFSQRAFLHGKIDLLQAEAINELIHANTQQALKQSLTQLDGSLSAEIEKIEKMILHAHALSEASFEFLDEEAEFASRILNLLNSVLECIHRLTASYTHQQQLRNGFTIALIGSVNAGKSSLFNALIKKDRAIVTPIAGTTRDSIECSIDHNGTVWTFIDTAGIRNTDDQIEMIGIERSYQAAASADIVLLIFDGSRALSEQENAVYQHMLLVHEQKTICVKTKQDLPQAYNELLEDKESISVARELPHTIEAVKNKIENMTIDLFATQSSPYLLTKRQIHLLNSLEQQVGHVITMLQDQQIAYELVSYHLNDTLAQLSELTGKSISEKSMDAIFKEFCVGK